MDSEDLSSIIDSADSYQSDVLSRASCSNLTNSNESSSSGNVAGSDVIVLLWQVFGPILLLVGFVGNILVLITMTRRRMRGTSTYVYLVGMATIDLVVLTVSVVPAWLNGSNIFSIKNSHPVACKLQKFLDYTSGDAAVWLRMAFTIDRLVAVTMPLYSGCYCGRASSAKIYIFAACVVAVAKDLHIFWTRGAQYAVVPTCTDNQTTIIVSEIELVSNCLYPTPEYEHFEHYVRPWIALALFSVGPFTVIAICNTLIVVALFRRRRSICISNSSLSRIKEEQRFYQAAAMCKAASGLFLVCTAPLIIVMEIGRPYWNVPPGGNAAYEISKAVTLILFYVTFSANFFLYCLSGKRFRTTLYGLCRRSHDSISLSTSNGNRWSTDAGKSRTETTRQTATNASAVRHRSNYRVAAAMQQSGDGTQSAAPENSPFEPNSRSNAVNGTASARETTAENAMPPGPRHVTHASVATRHSTTELVLDDDIPGTSCVTDLGTERLMTHDNWNGLTNIYSSDNYCRVNDGCVDVDECGRRDGPRQSNYQSESAGKQMLPVEETDDFEDPVADCSYTERTWSECDSDKNSLQSGLCRQRRLSDSVIDDNSIDLSERKNSFSSRSRIVDETSIENNVR